MDHKASKAVARLRCAQSSFRWDRQRSFDFVFWEEGTRNGVSVSVNSPCELLEVGRGARRNEVPLRGRKEEENRCAVGNKGEPRAGKQRNPPVDARHRPAK